MVNKYKNRFGFEFNVALSPQRQYGLFRDGEPRTSTSTFTHLLYSVLCLQFSVALRPQRPYGLLGTGAQDVHLDFHTPSVLCSVSAVQCCFTSTETVRTVRDGEPGTSTSTFTHLLYSVLCLQFSVALRPQRPYGLLGTGAQDVHLDFHTPSVLCSVSAVQCCFTSTETVRTIRDGSPGRPPRLSHTFCTLFCVCSSVLLYVHRDRTDY